jgi:hypothetical protein
MLQAWTNHGGFWSHINMMMYEFHPISKCNNFNKTKYLNMYCSKCKGTNKIQETFCCCCCWISESAIWMIDLWEAPLIMKGSCAPVTTTFLHTSKRDLAFPLSGWVMGHIPDNWTCKLNLKLLGLVELLLCARDFQGNFELEHSASKFTIFQGTCIRIQIPQVLLQVVIASPCSNHFFQPNNYFSQYILCSTSRIMGC